MDPAISLPVDRAGLDRSAGRVTLIGAASKAPTTANCFSNTARRKCCSSTTAG